ncbi:MAG TPA: peptidyl-prolyl cis-trans isomerase [Gemmatimonadaceae bacterium]|nr:peptidyl-prolyl cis-trans isomerase [Gemmatimonadaceae bacterium]
MRASAKYIFWFILITFTVGFLLMDTSGLLGLGGVKPTDPVAEVNGQDIPYMAYQQRVQQQLTELQQQGRTLSQDDQRLIENRVFDEMVNEVLLQQEYARRDISVTDDEVKLFAQQAPPPFLIQNPELQTNGQFDIEKYRRFLASPQARQSGILVYLENYYRTEIPRAKLFDAITSGVYVTDDELWRGWRDVNDTAVVSYVALRPPPNLTPDASIPDAELRRYWEQHKEELRRPGRAVVSLLEIRREVTASDSAATRARAEALRAEIAGGAKFEDVAKRESVDSVSGANGGSLGRGARGRFVPEFETAAYALQPGQLSQPVLTPFGYHIIRVDERKGDTLSLRHILLRIQPSDSNMVRIDRRADELSREAANADQPAKFDAAARKLGLAPQRIIVSEGQPAVIGSRVVPSVSAWAFGGARVGETSDLFDSEDGYVVARLDSLREGAGDDFAAVKEDVRAQVTRLRAVDKLMPQAEALARRAASSTLEQAAATANLQVEKTEPFTRASGAMGLGRLNEAVGAAFGLPVGAVSAPIRTDIGAYVIRVDRRAESDRKAFEGQKNTLREQRLEQLREQRLQVFLQELRRSADVDDRRKQLNALLRRQEG